MRLSTVDIIRDLLNIQHTLTLTLTISSYRYIHDGSQQFMRYMLNGGQIMYKRMTTIYECISLKKKIPLITDVMLTLAVQYYMYYKEIHLLT